MPNLKRLKPTTIVALDPHAAAFCEEVRRSLERDFGSRGRLIQTHALVCEGESLRLESDLRSVEDPRFDLQVSRNDAKRIAPSEARALFKREIPVIQSSLINILGHGRTQDEMSLALRDGIEISRDRMIYLLFSPAQPLASGVVLEFARFIKWLFKTNFPEEIHTLQAVLLLPDLFLRPNPEDYATTYACLATLDDSLAPGLTVGTQQKIPPFDGCWFIGGMNALGDRIGTLDEKLTSYSDALAGFLMSEPERSGPPPGILRGKPAAYSSFGHAELYYPAETIVKRLSNALARDITSFSFLANDEQIKHDNARILLLEAKQYVLGTGYTGILSGLDRDQGAPIWKPFSPKAEPEREAVVREYVSELQRRQVEFERKSLPGFQSTLLARGEQVQRDLVEQLDAEISRQADSSTDGFRIARELLEHLIDPHLALKADALSERPQSLITELREAQALLDQILGVNVDTSATETLLSQISEWRAGLNALEMNLSLTESPAMDPNIDGISPDDAGQTTSEEERQALLVEISATKLQIENAKSAYEHAVNQQDNAAHHLRREAQTRAREERANAITEAAEQAIQLGDQLSEAKNVLDDLDEERRAFIVRYFVLYPALAALLLVVPGLFAFLGVGFALTLVGLFWVNLVGFLVGFAVIAAGYLIPVLYKFLTGIHRQVNEARALVKSLAQSLSYSVLQLKRAFNEQVKLEYDLYAQDTRIQTLRNLINTARRRIWELGDTLRALAETRAEFARQHEDAVPSLSAMRRSVLSPAGIDAYYLRVIPDVGQKAAIFETMVRRSQARKMAIEEFRVKLITFARESFQDLLELSIEDILLGRLKVITDDEATLQLRELDNAAQTLLQLREIDAGSDQVAQRDTTIWAGGEEHDWLLAKYHKINPRADIHSSENDQKLRALTRTLNFPVYLLGQIEFYRDCYEQSGADLQGTPSPIPEELTMGGGVRHAHEQLLLAIAVGVVSKGDDDYYMLLKSPAEVLGNNRREIAEKFTSDFAAQDVYSELVALLQGLLADHDATYRHLKSFINSATDLDHFELALVEAALKKYHPLS